MKADMVCRTLALKGLIHVLKPIKLYIDINYRTGIVEFPTKIS